MSEGMGLGHATVRRLLEEGAGDTDAQWSHEVIEEAIRIAEGYIRALGHSAGQVAKARDAKRIYKADLPQTAATKDDRTLVRHNRYLAAKLAAANLKLAKCGQVPVLLGDFES